MKQIQLWFYNQEVQLFFSWQKNINVFFGSVITNELCVWFRFNQRQIHCCFAWYCLCSISLHFNDSFDRWWRWSNDIECEIHNFYCFSLFNQLFTKNIISIVFRYSSIVYETHNFYCVLLFIIVVLVSFHRFVDVWCFTRRRWMCHFRCTMHRTKSNDNIVNNWTFSGF